MSIKLEISQKEVFRYLGYRNITPDEQIIKLIEECKIEILNTGDFRHTYRFFDLELLPDDFIKINTLHFHSRNLTKNLKGCNKVILFAATLGPEVDRLLSRYSKINLSKAVVFQAVAAAAIEAYCNKCQKDLEEEMLATSQFLRPRFSPGYGDVSLSIQKDFLDLIKSTKTVGIILTEGDIMIPEKSVTAFIGVSSENTRCHIEGCEICGKTDCSYRRY